MSGLVEILLRQGFKVSGSDKMLTDITARLVSLGMTLFEGHSAQNIKDIDVLVYSSAVAEDNPELVWAREKKIPVIKRAEMLAEVTRMKYSIGIAGTHGKTTTTSMTGLVLTEGNLDPTIIVGGKLSSLGGTNARLGNGKFIVVEADEFDRTFLKLTPSIAVLTTLEKEHLDTYSGIDDLKAAFVEFANKVPFFGFVVLCLDEPALQDIVPSINKKTITYGISPQADTRAVDISHKGFTSTFTVIYNENQLGEITLKVPGLYNVKNALAAVAIAIELGVSFSIIKQSLESFAGVYRRFEVKYDQEIMVIDDYAHHPTETSATLSGVRSGWKRRLISVFQPHLYSRTRDFYEEFGRSFLLSDIFICTDVYPARELPIEGITGELIVKAACKFGHKNAVYVEDKNNLPSILKEIMKEGDIIVTMGAGDIWRYGEEFIKLIENKN